MFSFSFNRIRHALKDYQPLGRVGEVEDLCKLFAFVISDRNGFMTGVNLACDGGYLLEK